MILELTQTKIVDLIYRRGLLSIWKCIINILTWWTITNAIISWTISCGLICKIKINIVRTSDVSQPPWETTGNQRHDIIGTYHRIFRVQLCGCHKMFVCIFVISSGKRHKSPSKDKEKNPTAFMEKFIKNI